MIDAGICPGDLIVVHSSLKSIGYVYGGADTVIESLREAVGKNGGVLFPCLTFPGSVTQYLKTVQSIDLRKVEISTGLIPRTAWALPDAMHSIHPTHPVACFGKRAVESIGGLQSGQGPCGTDSPFYKAAMMDGKILMIGTSLGSCTTLHCVEEIASPYIYINEYFEVTTIDFKGITHLVGVKGYCVGVPRNFPVIEPLLLKEGIMKLYKLGNADLRVIDAKKMIEYALSRLKTDPFLLLAKDGHE